MNAKLIMATVKLTNINASIMMVVLNVIVLMVSPPLSPARIGFNSKKLKNSIFFRIDMNKV